MDEVTARAEELAAKLEQERVSKAGWHLVQELRELPDGSTLLRGAFVSEDKHKESREPLAEDGTPSLGFRVQTCTEISQLMLPLYLKFSVGSLISNRYRKQGSKSKVLAEVLTPQYMGSESLPEDIAARKTQSQNAESINQGTES